MNCGYCAEFCPFDAIKMDHDYELASYDRTQYHIHDKAKLVEATSATGRPSRRRPLPKKLKRAAVGNTRT